MAGAGHGVKFRASGQRTAHGVGVVRLGQDLVAICAPQLHGHLHVSQAFDEGEAERRRGDHQCPDRKRRTRGRRGRRCLARRCVGTPAARDATHILARMRLAVVGDPAHVGLPAREGQHAEAAGGESEGPDPISIEDCAVLPRRQQVIDGSREFQRTIFDVGGTTLVAVVVALVLYGCDDESCIRECQCGTDVRLERPAVPV